MRRCAVLYCTVVSQPQAKEVKPRPQLRRTSPFHEQFNEVSQLANVHSFEGFRLDVAKAVTPTFFSQHSIFFGSPQFPKGHYQVRSLSPRLPLERVVIFFDPLNSVDPAIMQ